jgi:DNA-binding NtrC family response regulator
MTKARVLVVDDLELWRDILKDVLEENYAVDTAASKEEALGLLTAVGTYQMVITDIGLTNEETNTDGIEILKAVHKLSPTTQTIAISGRAAVVNKEQFEKEYHTLVYLERDYLSNDINGFIDWVAKGVALSREAEKKG